MEAPADLVLTSLDRCEILGCGAKAWVRAYFTSDLYTQHCAHHAAEKSATFWSSAVDVVDERAYILGF